MRLRHNYKVGSQKTSHFCKSCLITLALYGRALPWIRNTPDESMPLLFVLYRSTEATWSLVINFLCYSGSLLYEIKMKHTFFVPENHSNCFHTQTLFKFFELAGVAGVHCASIALTVLSSLDCRIGSKSHYQ